MLKMESLLVFAAIAEAGSISAAARRLQISKSAASERLAELENSIGARHTSAGAKLTMSKSAIPPHSNSPNRRCDSGGAGGVSGGASAMRAVTGW